MTPYPLEGVKSSANRGNRSCLLAGRTSCSTCRTSLSQTCRKTTRDIAKCVARPARCFRNVSACSADRQQQSADVQALWVSPLTDSNRRPPPYHGGFERHARTFARSLATHFRLQNRVVSAVGDASQDVASAVSDVSVLCPRADAERGNAPSRGAHDRPARAAAAGDLMGDLRGMPVAPTPS
jgi:hypothetical protein